MNTIVGRCTKCGKSRTFSTTAKEFNYSCCKTPQVATIVVKETASAPAPAPTSTPKVKYPAGAPGLKDQDGDGDVDTKDVDVIVARAKAAEKK